MKTLRLLIFAVALIAFAVVIVPAAGAVTIGSKCVSNSGAPYTLFTTATASGESYVVPFNGVVTEWGTDHTDASDPGVVAAVFGSPSGPNWKLSQVTPFQFVAPGAVVSYPVRVPVSAGQFLGSTTVNDTNPVMCQTGNGTDAGVYGSAYSVGDSFAPTSINQYKAAIWATVEPDVDGDGYGDITQDKCPQSAAYQNTCPVLSISDQLSTTSNQIDILTTASVDTQLTAVAVVSVPKIGKKKAHRVTIQGTAQPFSAGKLKTIKLKLPSSVKNLLNSGTKLGAAVTVSGNGLANSATVTSKVKLK